MTGERIEDVNCELLKELLDLAKLIGNEERIKARIAALDDAEKINSLVKRYLYLLPEPSCVIEKCIICGIDEVEVGEEYCKLCAMDPAVIKKRREKRRYGERVSKGLCHCGKPTVAGRTTCEKHLFVKRRRDKARYDERKAKGLCTRCRKPPKPTVEGRTMCEEHLKKCRDRMSASKEATIESV